jgi:hypothetical protein
MRSLSSIGPSQYAESLLRQVECPISFTQRAGDEAATRWAQRMAANTDSAIPILA